MRNNNKVRAALTAAVVVLGVAAAGTGVAFATPATAPPPAAAQATPGGGGGQPPDIKQMDQMMQRMVQSLPADQRDAALRMHEQMRPAMAHMMAGDMGGMGQSNGGNGMMGR
ncbi:MAG: hypothetical protein M3Y48_20870 [Actinomycetota bacterium]|nr:hypothetical protein [Actinomycetota bacterium]